MLKHQSDLQRFQDLAEETFHYSIRSEMGSQDGRSVFLDAERELFARSRLFARFLEMTIQRSSGTVLQALGSPKLSHLTSRGKRTAGFSEKVTRSPQ